jgi:hypothetical protein
MIAQCSRRSFRYNPFQTSLSCPSNMHDILKAQHGGNRVNTRTLSHFNDWDERAKPTPLQFEI